MFRQALVIGDATLDLIVRSAAPPRAGGDVPAEIRLGPGGQAANVAVRLARRGWSVRLLTVLGSDAPGSLLRGWLDADQVEIVGPHASRSGIVAALIDARGERAMLSDRSGLSPEAIEDLDLPALLDGVDWVHLSGYVLADDASGGALTAALPAALAGRPLSLAGGSFGPETGMLDRWLALRPRLAVFDRAEAEVLAGYVGGAPDALARTLASASGGLAVVTDGAAGATAALADGPVLVAPPPPTAEVVDATGAGDAFTAVLIDGLAGEAWPPTAGRITRALAAAAIHGARVATVVGAQTPVPGEGVVPA